MASIGTLTANLALESAAFIRDFARAQRAVETNTAQMRKHMREVERAARNMERQFRAVRAGAAALAGALAVRQFTQFTRAAIDNAGAIQDVATKVGLTTQALQQMRFAAAQTGVAQNALDMGMQRFSRRLGEVAQGQGELLKTAEQYNVAIRDSEGRMRANVDILKDFAERIRTAEADQERLRIAFKLFDSEGAALVNTLRDGRVGLERYMEQAVAFGAVMSDTVIARAKLASDNLSALEQIYKTSFNTAIVEEFADGLTLTADNMKSAAEAGKAFGQLVGASMRAVTAAAKFVAANMREITAAIAALVALKAAGMFLALGAAVAKFAAAMVAAGRAGVFLSTVTSKSVLGVLTKLLVTATAAGAAWEVFGKSMTEQADHIDERLRSLVGGFGGMSDSLNSVLKDLSAQKTVLRSQIAAFDGSADAVAKAAAIQELYNAAAAAGIKAVDKLTDAEREQVLIIHESLKERRALARELESLQRIASSQDELSVLREERRLLMASEVERNVRLAQFRKELELKREGVDLTSDLAKQEIRLAGQTAEVRAELEKAAEARELFLEPFKNALGEIQRTFSDVFRNIFEGGVNSFKDLAGAVRSIMISLAAEVATLLVFRPAVGGILEQAGLGETAKSMGLGNPLGVLGGLGGKIDSFGANLGFADVGPDFVGPLAAGQTSGLTLSRFLGGAGLGFGVGAFANSLAGGNSTTGMIGSGLGAAGGAALGSIIPGVGTLIGAAIGGAAGGLLGALFGGGGGVGPVGHTNIGVGADGVLRVGSSGADNGADISATVAAAQQAVDTLNALAQQFDLIIRNAGPGSISQGNAGGPQSAAAFVSAFLSGGGFGSADPLVDRVLRSGKVGVNTLEGDIGLARLVSDLDSGMSALDKAIRDVTSAYEGQIARARELGLETEKLAQVRDREIAGLRAQARTPFAQAAGGIVDFVQQQVFAASSTASPTAQLTAAQRQFGDLLGRVRGGEVGLSGNLTRAAGQLLELGRTNFASSVEFTNLERFVRSSLLNVSETLASDEFFDAQVEATRQQTAEIVDAENGTTAAVEALRREIVLLRRELAA